MQTDLRQRNVVVTGGLGGLGAAVVQALRVASATCYLPVRKAPGTSAEDGVVITPGVDLTDEGAVAAYYQGLPALWGSVHVAGGFAAAPIGETPLATLRGQLDINLVTAFLCCREAARQMRRAGQGGRIVNVSSRAALQPTGGAVAYAAAKAAVNGLTQSLAEELKGDGILVNAIAPSIIDTPANRAAMPGSDPGRWPKPEEIAQTILWLLAPESPLTSGAIVPVYGRG